MKQKRLLIASAAMMMALVASLGNAQGSGSAAASSSNANSGSTSEVNAPVTVDMNMPTTNLPQQHQLIQAAPGPIPGMFPGNAIGPLVCHPYAPKLKNLKYISSAAIESLARGGKLPRGVKATTIDPDAANTAPYDGPIGIMEYDPAADDDDSDLALAGIEIPGKPFEIDEALLGVAIKALRKKAPAMQRVLVMSCPVFAEVTNTTSKGVGLAGSGTNATGQIGGGGSVGWFGGRSSTEQEQHKVLTVYAFNEPFDKLAPTTKPKAEPTTNQSETPPTPQQPIPAPAAMEAPAAQQPPPLPPPPPVAATTAPPLDDCLQNPLPKLNVPFAFASSQMTPEGLSVALRLESWLEQHPTCRVVMKGGACMHASKEHNLNLGWDRAETVYEVLYKNEKIRSRLIKPESHGKQQATLTGSKTDMAEDRVVYFAVEVSDSH